MAWQIDSSNEMSLLVPSRVGGVLRTYNLCFFA